MTWENQIKVTSDSNGHQIRRAAMKINTKSSHAVNCSANQDVTFYRWLHIFTQAHVLITDTKIDMASKTITGTPCISADSSLSLDAKFIGDDF